MYCTVLKHFGRCKNDHFNTPIFFILTSLSMTIGGSNATAIPPTSPIPQKSYSIRMFRQSAPCLF